MISLTSAKRKKANRYMKVYGNCLYCLLAAQSYLTWLALEMYETKQTNLFPSDSDIPLSFGKRWSRARFLEDDYTYSMSERSKGSEMLGDAHHQIPVITQ